MSDILNYVGEPILIEEHHYVREGFSWVEQ